MRTQREDVTGGRRWRLEPCVRRLRIAQGYQKVGEGPRPVLSSAPPEGVMAALIHLRISTKRCSGDVMGVAKSVGPGI